MTTGRSAKVRLSRPLTEDELLAMVDSRLTVQAYGGTWAIVAVYADGTYGLVELL